MNAMQPPQNIEEIKAGLETTEKGGVRQSIRNCLTVFQRDPLLSGAIAYNILTDRKDIIKPIGFHRESTALNDTDMKYLLLYLEETYGLTNEKKIDNAIGIVANENKYHPIRDYLSALVWDGTERIRFCLRHFLGADADDYTYEALKLFLLGTISRAFQPGCKFEIMLCLVGGQGAGKSTFFRLLAVRDEWFSDDLRKLDDDNVYRKLQGHWIIEMSEMMATANAKSIEEIKSFLSRQKEVYKIPYETHPADRPRQCVFGGTSNALDFLPLDRSGNRRFIPVMVYPEQAEVHILEDEAASRAYIEQMWAEAMEIYRSGRFKLAFSPAMQRYLKEHPVQRHDIAGDGADVYVHDIGVRFFRIAVVPLHGHKDQVVLVCLEVVASVGRNRPFTAIRQQLFLQPIGVLAPCVRSVSVIQFQKDDAGGKEIPLLLALVIDRLFVGIGDGAVLVLRLADERLFRLAYKVSGDHNVHRQHEQCKEQQCRTEDQIHDPQLDVFHVRSAPFSL